jgi:hypothetical protein
MANAGAAEPMTTATTPAPTTHLRSVVFEVAMLRVRREAVLGDCAVSRGCKGFALPRTPAKLAVGFGREGKFARLLSQLHPKG